MRRRELLAVMGVMVLPAAGRAQQNDRTFRVAILTAGETGELGARQRAVFKQTLTEFGWEGKIQIDHRSAANDVGRTVALARELLSLKPDVIVVQGTRAVAALQRETTTPIIFVSVLDPVRSGIVTSLASPGGNTTGFSNFEPTLAGKYIEILKDVAPAVTSVAVMSNPNSPLNILREPLEAAARYHKVELRPTLAADAEQIERVIASLGGDPSKALLVSGDPLFGSGPNLALIVSLAMRHRVPAIYSFRHFAEAGGLVSYGNDLVEQYRQAASYVDRILKGASPADLPVQAPTRFELVINLKTARAMGLAIPPSLLARADEVIE